MDESWKETVADLLASYLELGGLNHSDTHNMPSKRAVGTICEDLLRLLFPGFHDDDAVQKESFLDLTTERLATTVQNLQTQVRKGVRIGDPHRPTGRTRPILLKFVKDLPEIRRLLTPTSRPPTKATRPRSAARKSSSPTRASRPSPSSASRTGSTDPTFPSSRA